MENKNKKNNKSSSIIIKPKIKLQYNNIKKERNPGVDLLRILGMIDIIAFHIIMHLYPKYYRYTKKIKYMEILTQWHISNFGIISGIVGYKTNKYSNLLYLWLWVLYHSLTIHYIFKKFYPRKLTNVPKNEYFLPLISNHYWYFTSYFKMYLFLPLINKGLNSIDKTELKIIILSLYGILFIWKDLKSKERDKFCRDQSVKTLLSYYLLGAYIGKFVLDKNKDKNKIIKIIKNLIYYIILIFIFIKSSNIVYYSTFYEGNDKYKLILKKLFYNSSNSIGMVLLSLSLILFFTQIKYNKYIAKIITFFGPLAFSSYLVHNHIDVRSSYFLTRQFSKYSSNLTPKYITMYVIYEAVRVFMGCIAIDYIRFMIFKLLKIREICGFLEKIVFAIFKRI